MTRPYPDRRRTGKGRPPPNKYRGARPAGFTPGGLGRFYDLVLPGVRGPGRGAMFSLVADGSALACGAVGLGSADVVGAAVGLAAGYAAANGFLVKGRFIRR